MTKRRWPTWLCLAFVLSLSGSLTVSAQGEINPLTGLPVADPAVLNRRPMLVKVSNHGTIIRPQSGLSFADHVWEYQMEGWQITRYSAIFYGQTPPLVGSVRSTRLIDAEHLVDMYGAILVTSGGSTNHANPVSPPRIEERLRAASWARRVVSESWIGDAAYGRPYLDRPFNIPRPGIPRYHRLFAFPPEIWRLMSQRGLNDRPTLSGIVFDANLPPNGRPALEVDVDYPGVGPKHIWAYDRPTGKWLSWTQDQTGRRWQPGRPDVDYLNGQQLAFDNIVVLYAEHYEADFIEDEAANLNSIGINLLGEGRAILFRDGQRYEGVWRRYNAESLMQVFDANGPAIPYKPGTIWYNVTASNLSGAEIKVFP